jgi:hypothetical protein
VKGKYLVGFIIKKLQGLHIVYEKDDQLLFVTVSRQYLEPNSDISNGYLGFLLGIKRSKHVDESGISFCSSRCPGSIWSPTVTYPMDIWGSY